MNRYAKKERIKFIKEILTKYKVSSQKQVADLLKKQGLSVSQPTVARDFEEIGVVKVRKNNMSFYRLPEKGDEMLKKRLKAAFENFVIDVIPVDNLILVKTVPGNAGGVANLIDHSGIEGVAGTIAGDDTVLVVTFKNKTRNVLRFFDKTVGKR